MDLGEVRRWVAAVAGDAGASMHWQTYDDSHTRKARLRELEKLAKAGQATDEDSRELAERLALNEQLTRAIEGTVDQVADKLDDLNRQGAGIFAAINVVRPGARRLAENVTNLRALFIDHDAKDGDLLADPMESSCPPSMVVRSGGGRHYYWLLDEISRDGVPVEWFRAAQRRMIAYYGSDSKIHDLPRVLRVPGFDHCKNEYPWPVVIKHLASSRYNGEEVLAAHPVDQVVDSAPVRTAQNRELRTENEARTRASAWLAKRDPAIEGQGGDNHTYATACALMDFGLDDDEVLQLLEEWNLRCVPPWSERELGTKVRSARKSRQNTGGVKLDDRPLMTQGQKKPTRSGPTSPADQGGSDEPPAPPQDAAAEDSGAHSPEPDERARSELHLSQLLLLWHGEDLRFCFDEAIWYVWDGKRFQADLAGETWERAKDTVMRYSDQLMGERRAMLDRADQLEDDIPSVKKGLQEQAREIQQQAEECDEQAKNESDQKAAQELNERAVKLREQVRKLMQQLDQTGAQFAAEAKGLRAEARKRQAEAIAIQKHTVIKHTIELAQSAPSVRIAKNDFDGNARILNCQNGILDLRTGKILPHNRRAKCSKITAVEYHEHAAGAEDLSRIVANICDEDPGTIAYMQQALGASLLGNNRFEEFYLVSGAAGCGKGTLFEGVKMVLGDYCATSEFTTWLATNQPRIRDDLAGLQGARVILSSEVEKGSTLSSQVLKTATGNDTMRCRHLYGRYFEYRPTYTIWLQANARPRLDHSDPGLWRRLRNIHVPETRALRDGQRDPRLKERMLDPSKGGQALLAWMVAGCLQVAKATQIQTPEAVLVASAHYRMDQDPLRDFILDCLRFSSNGDRSVRVTNDDLAVAYERWANREKLSPRLRVTPKRLRDRLTEMGAEIGQSMRLLGRSWKGAMGVTLATDAYDEDSDTGKRMLNLPVPTDEEHLRHCALHGVVPEVDSTQSLKNEASRNHGVTALSESPHVCVGAGARTHAHGDSQNLPLHRDTVTGDSIRDSDSLDIRKEKNKNEKTNLDGADGPEILDPWEDH